MFEMGFLNDQKININPGGEHYEGELLNHDQHSQGILHYPDGSIFEGKFKNSQPV
jgi:hypothetical protein